MQNDEILLDDKLLDENIVDAIKDHLFNKIHDDEEGFHKIEDNLMKKFISDLSENKIDVSKIQKIASLIREINDYNIYRWYA